MIRISYGEDIRIRYLAPLWVAAALMLAPTLIHAHGGKTHAETRFSHLEALQQATQLFDKLIAAGKLDESWELGLNRVDIADRNGKDGPETAVSFTRATGEPSTVYFFFSNGGRYAGSNFTGR